MTVNRLLQMIIISPRVIFDPGAYGEWGVDLPKAMARNGYPARNNSRSLQVPATWWLTRDLCWSMARLWNFALYGLVFMRNFSIKYNRYAKMTTVKAVTIIAQYGAQLDIDPPSRYTRCARTLWWWWWWLEVPFPAAVVFVDILTTLGVSIETWWSWQEAGIIEERLDGFWDWCTSTQCSTTFWPRNPRIEDLLQKLLNPIETTATHRFAIQVIEKNDFQRLMFPVLSGRSRIIGMMFCKNWSWGHELSIWCRGVIECKRYGWYTQCTTFS